MIASPFLLVCLFLLAVKIEISTSVHKKDADKLIEWGYFQGIEVESVEYTMATPRSRQSVLGEMLKPCSCFYGSAVLTEQSMRTIMDQYTWEPWTITAQEWDAQDLPAAASGFCPVTSTMLEFDQMKERLADRYFLVSQTFEETCMKSSILNVCNCYVVPDSCTMLFYHYTD